MIICGVYRAVCSSEMFRLLVCGRGWFDYEVEKQTKQRQNNAINDLLGFTERALPRLA